MNKQKIDLLAKQLHSISYEATLQRGFAIVEDEEGNILKNIDDIKINQKVKTRINGGSIIATVTDKEAN